MALLFLLTNGFIGILFFQIVGETIVPYFYDINLYHFIFKRMFSISALLLSFLHDFFLNFGSKAHFTAVTGIHPPPPFILVRSAVHATLRGRGPDHLRLELGNISSQTTDLCLRFFKYSLIVLSINSYFICTKYSLPSNNPDCFFPNVVANIYFFDHTSVQ